MTSSSPASSERKVRVAINGFGRIGELVFRNLVHRDLADRVQVVAINDIISLEQIVYLLRFDSVHRTPEAVEKIESGPGWLRVDDHDVRIFEERDPAQLPWRELEVDIVVDATGVFRDREGMSKHIAAGARKVVLTAPARGDDGADVTLCMGVNHEDYDSERHHLVSNASCTTNCLAPVARAIDEAFGIEWGVMSTIHAYTGTQALIDQADTRPRRGRAAAWNIVPSTTGAAKAIGMVLPRLEGKVQGMAFRVPVPDGSCIDFTVGTREPLTKTMLHAALASAEQDPSFRGVLTITEDELVSSDILGSSRSAIVEAPSTLVVNDHVVKVVAWYDNEWGYARRVVDLVDMVAEMM